MKLFFFASKRLGNTSSVRQLRRGAVAHSLEILTIGACCWPMSLWRPSLSLSKRASTIHTDKFTTFALTIFKATLLELAPIGVVVCTHNVVDMRSVLGGVRTVSCTEREFVCAHKVVPFFDLDPFAFLTGNVVAENQPAFGVTCAISAVGVEFSTVVTSLDVHLGEIAYAGDLQKVGRLEELDSRNGSVGDQTCAIADLRQYDTTDSSLAPI